MSESTEIHALIIKMAGDIGQLTQASKTQTEQIGLLFTKVDELNKTKCEEVGIEKGKTDLGSRALAIINLIISGFIAWFYFKGGGH